MIYFGTKYRDTPEHRGYALWGGLLIMWTWQEAPWGTLQAFQNISSPMTAADRCMAHYLPECRDVDWHSKASHHRRLWRELLMYGITVRDEVLV